MQSRNLYAPNPKPQPIGAAATADTDEEPAAPEADEETPLQLELHVAAPASLASQALKSRSPCSATDTCAAARGSANISSQTAASAQEGGAIHSSSMEGKRTRARQGRGQGKGKG